MKRGFLVRSLTQPVLREQSVTEQLPTERLATERPPTQHPATEQPSAERPATERSGDMVVTASFFQRVMNVIKFWQLRVNGQLALTDDPTRGTQEYIMQYAAKL